jgi:hypothetical protein
MESGLVAHQAADEDIYDLVVGFFSATLCRTT